MFPYTQVSKDEGVESMRCYVTGCAGFIGSNLVKRLKALDHEVFGYDNMSTGIVDDNVDQPEYFEDLDDIDCIFHLGMPSSSPLYKERPVEMCEEMVGISMEMLELARANKCPIIYASSSSLYNGHDPPHRESMQPFIKDYYTEMRYWLERMATYYSDQFGVRTIGLRIFSCYGHGDVNKGKIANVVTQFALDMFKGKRPLIFGDGNQSRDFIHVDDVVDGFLKAAFYPRSDIFNLGTGKAYSFNECVNAINEVLGSDITPLYTNNQIHNYVFSTRANIHKAKAMLGFRAKPFTERFPEYIEELRCR